MITQIAATLAVDSGWPTTVSGWVALVASLTTLVTVVLGGAIAYGKSAEQFNRLKDRVSDLETAQEGQKGMDEERRSQLDRVLGEHATILGALGESKRSVEQCRDDADQYTREIGAKVADVLRAMGQMELSIVQRLTAVETILKERKVS